jgi:hypothetical protein
MNKQGPDFLRSRQGWVLLGFLAVAGYFLWTEHRAHVIAGLSYLPYLLLLACPLMHIFMHGGHGGHDHGAHDKDSSARRDGDAP